MKVLSSTFLELSINHLLETQEAPPRFHKFSADKNSGDSTNTCLPSIFYISENQLLYSRILHVLVKSIQVKSQFFSNLLDLRIIQVFVVFE